MKRKPTIINTYLVSMMLIGTCGALLVGCLWIFLQYRDVVEEASSLRQQNIRSQKQLLKQEVEDVLEFINYTKNRERNLHTSYLKEHAQMIYEICSDLYETHKPGNNEEFIQIIKESIDIIHHYLDCGFLCILDEKDNVILCPRMPLWENKNIYSLKTPDGSYIIEQGTDIKKVVTF